MSLRSTNDWDHMEAIGDLRKTSFGGVVGRKALLEWV